jgi:2-dehydropantoate 2-reductase
LLLDQDDLHHEERLEGREPGGTGVPLLPNGERSALMKVLVYGAGVIGCYLAHVLCEAGNEVSLLARGEWKETLEKNGLVIRHHLQNQTTIDHTEVIGQVDAARHYDVVFAVMQYQQMQAILGDLAQIDTPLVVLVGNDLSAPAMEREILRRSKTPKTVLFGFQSTAGNREGAYVGCVRWGGGALTLGGLHRALTEKEKNFFAKLFTGTKFRLSWEEDMDGWYKCHLAFVLPIAYLCYLVGCDLRKTTRAQRKQMLDATDEGFGLLRKLGIAIRPAGEDAYYRPGPKRAFCAALMFVMAKTALGELCASDHCRHAVSELEALDKGWDDLRMQAPDFSMPNWDALRAAAPNWEALHHTYDGQREAEGGVANRP